MADRKHRVVIVGGGFGGLAAAKALAGADVEIVLIDRRNHHLFQPLLYQVATAALSPSEIAWPIRHLLRRQSNARVLMATVIGVDQASRAVLLEDGGSVAYDSLVLATGAQHAYFGHDDWETFAPGLKTVEDATAIRRKLLLALEAAERETDPARRRALLTFAIIGAGPTGVEMAGAIVELGHTSIKGQFNTLSPADLRVVLIEGADRVLLNFEPDLSEYTLNALRRMGVEVELGQPVVGIDRDGVSFGDQRLDTKTIIWAAGVAASPVAKWLGIDSDRAGRVQVEPDLSVPGLPDIFVIGDVAGILQPNGKPVPGVAPAAKQAGKHVARVIRRRLSGDMSALPFRYKHAGDLATIGKSSAVIDFGWLKLKGWFAWWVWGFAHIYFLVETRTRIVITMNWLWIYLTGQRSARLITHGEATSRKPLDEVDED
ncbi:NAD(P)/FAD-dependent oxidoreductase [Devosia sp. YIM 151766]|uniref:NAD(P)/FAD-dependent oxidoreductase n=1 Tax=Devosia sp. YIM 151766 TaxID=3017325 RepID=UPI00255C5B60|nr:NAD(P)/FAD-dependent oxidoreductase [Devosia sp. YIM 151766]WIY53699.1 NAD(P)/FAD-dependent oxidoreductase [Devosia sp. YIM 151766]